MDIKINRRLLSIPPYISTSWSSIQSLSMEGKRLHVILADGSIVEIPGLEPEILEHIFATHALVLESDESFVRAAKPRVSSQQITQMGDQVFQIGFAAVDELGTVMQHNPAQADSPNIPDYVLEKITVLAKAMAPDDISVLPKAEPNCNCMHCQITRAINRELQPLKKEIGEEIVSDQDLTFEQWEIKQTGDDMFTVTNKLDTMEHYNVFLGSPVGCTCGRLNCEHIVAVLKS